MQSTWAWRAPSAVQGIFSIFCIVILPFIPESPRWLAHEGRLDEALTVVGQIYADGDIKNAIVQTEYQEIIDTIEWERAHIGETLKVMQMVKTPSARKRLSLSLSVAVFSTISGEKSSSPKIFLS